MAPPTSEELSVYGVAKPFKSEAYAERNIPRRNKTLKQILNAERDATLAKLGLSDTRGGRKRGGGGADGTSTPMSKRKRLTGAAARRRSESEVAEDVSSPAGADSAAATPPAEERGESEAPAEEPAAAEAESHLRNLPTYTSVEAPPSLIPTKKYCDVTGLKARYTDPKSRLHYHSVEVYEIIRGFGPGVDNAYLSLRGHASQLF